MSAAQVVVVGGGVAGCAAAVAAAEHGARTLLVEHRRHLGGVAVAGEHRTLCGLAPIDAASPELLEPALTADWVAALATGRPRRQGRVWLWPTTPSALAEGLGRRLAAAGVEVRLGMDAQAGAPLPDDQGLELRLHGSLPGTAAPTGAGAGGRPEDRLTATALVDASGQGALASWLGLPRVLPAQWGSCRASARFPGQAEGPAARLRLLARLQMALGGSAGIALTELGGDCWQVSIDCAPGAAPASAHAALARAVAAAGGEQLSSTLALAERDQGRPLGDLDLPELFATSERGWCWAAWPREEHTAEGVRWTWPARDRHGLPARAVRAAGMPAWSWCIGKGMPVSVAAASALRVTGTCLALGAAVGASAGQLSAPR